jgi:HSP20 family protein
MNLVRRTDSIWNPARDLQELQDQINSLFEFDLTDPSGLFDRHSSPAVDILEEDDGFLITADLPGVDKKDLDISITRNVVTIKGEKHDEASHKDKKHYRTESWTGSFQRTLSLPDMVDPERVEAKLKDGLLTVHVSKREELKPRQIEVSVQ